MDHPLSCFFGGAVKQTGKTGTNKPDQLSLHFPQVQCTFGDLITTPANETAFRVAKTPEQWPQPVICIAGPVACGLTSLARAWAGEFSATFLDAKSLARLKRQAISNLAAGYIAIDDADATRSPEALLTLLNSVPDAGGRLLLTSHLAPGSWHTSSPDLKSRLNSLSLVEIHPPDEAMVRGRLMKRAGDYFLRLEEDLVKYLVPRLELSYEAVEAFVERLSDAVTLTGRAPSVPMAKDILDSTGATGSGSRSDN